MISTARSSVRAHDREVPRQRGAPGLAEDERFAVKWEAVSRLDQTGRRRRPDEVGDRPGDVTYVGRLAASLPALGDDRRVDLLGQRLGPVGPEAAQQERDGQLSARGAEVIAGE